MNESAMNLDDLVLLARTGDLQARAELRQRLAPQMPRIVRRALRAESAPTAMNRRIRQTAAALAHQEFTQPAPENQGFIQRLARRVFGLVSGEVQAPAALRLNLRETIRC